MIFDSIFEGKSPLYKANFYVSIGALYEALTELCHAYIQSEYHPSILKIIEKTESFLPQLVPLNYVNLFSIRAIVINKKKDVDKRNHMSENVLENKFKEYKFQDYVSVKGITSNYSMGCEYFNESKVQAYISALEETIIKDNKPVIIFDDDIEETKWHSTAIPIPIGADCYFLGFSKNASVIYPIGLGIAKIEKTFYLHAKVYFNTDYAKAVIKKMKQTCLWDQIDNYSAAIYNIIKEWNCYGSHRPMYKKKMPFCENSCFEDFTGSIAIYSSKTERHLQQSQNIPPITYKQLASINKKWAIVSIGHYRTFDKICNNLRRETEILNPDYFFHTWTTQNSITKSWHSSLIEEKELTKDQISKLKEFDPDVVIEEQLSPDNYPSELDKNQTQSQKPLYAVWYSFHALQSALKRIKNSGKKYDYIFVTRFDIELQNIHLDLVNIRNKEILMGRSFLFDDNIANDIVFCFDYKDIDYFLEIDFFNFIIKQRRSKEIKNVEDYLTSFFKKIFEVITYQWQYEIHFKIIR